MCILFDGVPLVLLQGVFGNGDHLPSGDETESTNYKSCQIPIFVFFIFCKFSLLVTFHIQKYEM